jgi:hypothetical protein
MGYKILTTSKSLRKEILRLMAPGKTRRVAISAFVGDGAGAFLPQPDGVEIVCWPKAGGTNPWELQKLKGLGARIRFADSLHMKVYWAFGRGTVVTSANLSTNALGAGGLKEIGVLLDHKAVDIDALISSLNTREFNNADMQKLYKAHRTPMLPPGRCEAADYLEWCTGAAPEKWKLGWWGGTTADFAQSAKDLVKRNYGKTEPRNFISCREDDYEEHDCVLQFCLTEKGPSSAMWLHVDHVVKVSRTDRGVYERKYPYQAIQVHAEKIYQPPPFSITPRFRTAFRAACLAYGVERLKSLRTTQPPKAIIDMIAARMKK